jgi:Flp pilus assembly protein TadB
MTPALIGGILLIIGSLTIYMGKIFWSVGIFFLADCCWIIIALQTGDVLGSIFVVIGMTLGLLAFVRMQTGKMRKDLKL